jgi:glycosyltransferase involved in cell wall biosynthesis
MKRKKILMGAANYWPSPLQVGSHHLAREFVKLGWDVAFVSDPISPWHLAGTGYQQLRERYRLYFDHGEWDLDGHLWAYVPGALLTPHNKPVLKSRWVSRSWARLSWPRIGDVLNKVGFSDVDLIYCDTAVPFSWLRAIPHRKSVYRIADQYMGFNKFSRSMSSLEEELAQWVDVVVYAARGLESHVKALRPRNMAHVPNGVSFNHFFRPRSQPNEYQHISRPIAVYVGAMDVWFDWKLMNLLVERLPDVSFVLIGPDDRAKKLLKPARNLWVLGSRPYDDLPAYLQHANVGLIPFDVANQQTLVRTIHPLKLYEYLASGLPVVAIEWQELESLNSPATLTRSSEEFIAAIRKVIELPPPKSLLQPYAADKDWSQTVQKLLELTAFS